MDGGTPAANPTPVELIPKPDVPIACTLDAGDVPERIAAWAKMLEGSLARTPVGAAGMRIDFAVDVDLDALTELIAAEHACCAFFSFELALTPDRVSLEVHAPDDAAAIVLELFG